MDDKLTLNECEALVEKWKPRLGLAHWRIKVRLLSRGNMSQPHHIATVFAQWALMRAVIDIREPGDVSDNELNVGDDYQDVEVSIVHEMLHLIVGPFSDEEYRVDREQGIEIASQALVAIDRREYDDDSKPAMPSGKQRKRH